jgi:fibro-slime domain-containing protein
MKRNKKYIALACLAIMTLSFLPSSILLVKAEDPSGGFVGIYRNFNTSHPDFDWPSGTTHPAPETGLILPTVPWRPNMAKPTPFQDDWYKTSDCLIRIDPVEYSPFGAGLYFTPSDFQAISELIGGASALFTVEWEARINVPNSTYLQFKMVSNDDSWCFFDGQLILDLGGGHTGVDAEAKTYGVIVSAGIHTITIYYAERNPGGGNPWAPASFRFGIMAGPFNYIDVSDLYAKKSFEDLLRHQAEGIESFEDLLNKTLSSTPLPPENTTTELFESFENLTKQQEGLLKSFEDMIAEETPQVTIFIVVHPGLAAIVYNASRLLPAEFVNLLDSFENLLHRQYNIKESFMDLLNQSKTHLQTYFPMFLNSTEDLLTSDDDLLKSFEDLAGNLFLYDNYIYTIDQQTYFLESYEHLLENQSRLLEKFEKLIPDPSKPKATAIHDGLTWLVTQQDPATGAWNEPGYPVASNLGYYPVASTAFAVLKLEEYAYKTLGVDPFTSAYTDYPKVVAGWNYIFGNAHKQALTTQPRGDPEEGSLLQDGYGIYFQSPYPYDGRPIYETGIVMMALEASGYAHTGDTSAVPNPGGAGYLTYKQVMEEAVDYVSWAQNDFPNPGEGGWRYGPYDNAVLKYGKYIWPGNDSDNSVSQWPVLGLISALGWGINAPSWVADELSKWLKYTQQTTGSYLGSFHYTGPLRSSDHENIALTAAGIIQLYYENLCYGNVPVTDLRVSSAFAFIVSDWTGSLTTGSGEDQDIGNLYAMYGVMKACVLYGIVASSSSDGKIHNSTTSIDWQTDYDNWLLATSPATQDPSGYWTTSPEFDQPGYTNEYRVLATEWALLILEKIAPPPVYPPFKESFEDLLRRQSDRIESFENLLGNLFVENMTELTVENKTSELLESFENLAKQQEGLLKSFQEMINATSLPQARFISLLNSSEDLLHRQCGIKESFLDLLNETKPYLGANFTELMSSAEDLLRSDAELLKTFEGQVRDLFSLNVTIYWKTYFLESYEHLLEEQSKLLKKFEEIDGPPGPPAVHDVAVIDVTISKTIVGQGFSATVTAIVGNVGSVTETFSVTAYANNITIASQNVTLTSGNFTTITFTWSTARFSKGNYTISAYAWPVPGETHTADNTFVAHTVVHVVIPGDADLDKVITILDVVTVANRYGTKTGDRNYDANLDWNDDGKIDILDIVIVTSHYAQKDP